MRYLIVNADDFGYSFSVNKGIIEAHTDGVVTSTTVLVDAIAAEETAGLTKYKDLSVGLHFFPNDLDKAEEELQRQAEKLESLLGRKPDHIDTHKMQPDTDERVEKVLREYSQKHKVPIRGFGVKRISSFYGTGEQKEELVSIEVFKSAIDEATEKYNEIICHVGYSDDYLREKSSYNEGREKELLTIKSPEIREYIESKEDLQLCNWNLVREQRF